MLYVFLLLTVDLWCGMCIVQVNDAESLRAARIAPSAVGRVVDEAFAEMTFLHGYIHADPHPGNIMVRQKGEIVLGIEWTNALHL